MLCGTFSRMGNVRQSAYLANINAVQKCTAFQEKMKADCGTKTHQDKEKIGREGVHGEHINGKNGTKSK